MARVLESRLTLSWSKSAFYNTDGMQIFRLNPGLVQDSIFLRIQAIVLDTLPGSFFL